jgi:hypothetical protein
MAKGTCNCGRRAELFDGQCLKCITAHVSSGRRDIERMRHQDIDERTQALKRQYRSHGDYAMSPEHPHHMTAAERRALPATAYALRKHRLALPLRSKHPGSARDYIIAASGRLRMMQNLGHLLPGEYEEGRHNIREAARRAGIHSHLPAH